MTTGSETSLDPRSEICPQGSETSLEENLDDSVFSSNLNEAALLLESNRSPPDHLSHPEEMVVSRENERNLHGTKDEVNLVCIVYK